jgi:hypothetical protein
MPNSISLTAKLADELSASLNTAYTALRLNDLVMIESPKEKTSQTGEANRIGKAIPNRCI